MSLTSSVLCIPTHYNHKVIYISQEQTRVTGDHRPLLHVVVVVKFQSCGAYPASQAYETIVPTKAILVFGVACGMVGTGGHIPTETSVM